MVCWYWETRTVSGCHQDTYTSAHREHVSVQQVSQRRQNLLKSPFYIDSGGILLVIQEQEHRVRKHQMSQNSFLLMYYVRVITRL